MKNNVIKLLSCENCGAKTDEPVRYESVTGKLSDQDVRQIVGAYLEQPWQYSYCDGCNIYALMTVLGFEGYCGDE